MLYLGSTAAELRPWFADVRPVGVTGPTPIEGTGQDAGATLWLATGRLAPWDAIWPSLRHLDVQ